MAWLLGLLTMLSLGTAQVMLGLALGSYDQRRHIPGHLFFKALVAAPGLVQLLYLVPCIAPCKVGSITGWPGGFASERALSL
jgi:hypothetical protein